MADLKSILQDEELLEKIKSGAVKLTDFTNNPILDKFKNNNTVINKTTNLNHNVDLNEVKNKIDEFKSKFKNSHFIKTNNIKPIINKQQPIQFSQNNQTKMTSNDLLKKQIEIIQKKCKSRKSSFI